MCVFLFRGVSGGIVVLLSSLASFVVSTRLIQSRIGAIDSPDQSRQGFEQYNTSEVLEKNFSGDFSIACRQKMLMFGIFKACTSKFAYYKLYQRKLKVITRKKYALHILIRPLGFSLEIRENESNLHESSQKNLEAVSKN